MWKRYSPWLSALGVPLQMAPALLIITFSVLLWLASAAGLLGLPLALIVLSWFFKYSFVLLDGCVAGRTDPPVLSIEMINPASEQRPLAMLMWVIVVYFATDASDYWFGPAAGWIVAGLSVTALPAMLGIQAVSGRVTDALNPITVWGFMRRLQLDYVVLFVSAAMLLFISDALVSSGIFETLPLAVRLMVPMYAWLTLFALVGIVVNERGEALGTEDASEPDTDFAVVDEQAHCRHLQQRERFLDRVYAEWRGGSHRAAQQSIEVHLGELSDSTAELQWMYERASRWPDQRLAEWLAQRLLTKLLAARASSAALHVIRERMRNNAMFRPVTSDELLTLVRLARDGGDRPTARALLVDFERYFPNDVLGTAAQALTQQLQR